MPLKLTTYYHGKDIPELPGKNAFHSKELFQIYEATPGYTPLLIVATEDGRPVARLLAAIRKAKKWLPSSLVKHCVVYSEGEFLDESLSTNKEKAEEVFGDMLEHLTQEASRSCVLIEFRNLNNSMFGYRVFRANDYFPVNWLRVRNSLHSMKKTEDRFSPSRIRQIKKRTQEWSQSRGSTYRGRNTRFLTDAAQGLFLPHTQIFPCQRLFPSHERYANQRTAGKNIRSKIQRENHWRFRLYLLGR